MEIIKCGMCGKLKLKKEEVMHCLDVPQCADINTTFYAEKVCDRCFERYIRHVMDLKKELRNARY